LIGGRIIDVNNSNEGGPFTPQRAGSLPILQLVDLCFSGAYSDAESLKRELTTAGGLVSYLGTASVEETLGRISDGDDEARRVLDAMIYQISKEIGSYAAALRGEVDAVFLTGGFARPPMSDWIAERTRWIAPILTFPGEGELEALATAAARFLRGEETPKRY
jgi:butyrate kinase